MWRHTRQRLIFHARTLRCGNRASILFASTSHYITSKRKCQYANSELHLRHDNLLPDSVSWHHACSLFSICSIREMLQVIHMAHCYKPLNRWLVLLFKLVKSVHAVHAVHTDLVWVDRNKLQIAHEYSMKTQNCLLNGDTVSPASIWINIPIIIINNNYCIANITH